MAAEIVTMTNEAGRRARVPRSSFDRYWSRRGWTLMDRSAPAEEPNPGPSVEAPKAGATPTDPTPTGV